MNNHIKHALLFACIMTILDLLGFLFKYDSIINILTVKNSNLNLIVNVFLNFLMAFIISLLLDILIIKTKRK